MRAKAHPVLELVVGRVQVGVFLDEHHDGVVDPGNVKTQCVVDEFAGGTLVQTWLRAGIAVVVWNVAWGEEN
jgi:hypothetical protein